MGEDELIEIGQTSEDLDIDLLAGSDFLDSVDVRALPGFNYPAMLISGVKFKDTLRVLQTVHRSSYRSFDVWIDLGDGTEPVKQGKLPASIETFLAMRYLGLNVTLYWGYSEVDTLDLRDVSVLEKFI